MTPAFADLPFPETLDLTPDIDGYRLWFKGSVIGKWNTLTGAARGLTTAREALAMLEAVFASGSLHQCRKAV
jgi:hypothetical protein